VSSPYIELIEVISSNNSSDISPEINVLGLSRHDDHMPSLHLFFEPVTFSRLIIVQKVRSE
jgi:hypothetical protein